MTIPSYMRPGSVISLEWSWKHFQEFVREFAKECEYDTAAAVQYTARELGMRVVARTPQRTKRAVAGWSKPGQKLSFSVPHSSYSKRGDSTYSQRLTGPNPYIRFDNHVPYIMYLEYGWSSQAPLGMVRISVAEMRGSGILPAILAKSYQARWEGMGRERYSMQESIMRRGLPAVKTGFPSRRSVAARMSHEVRRTRAAHGRSGILTRIQRGLQE